MLNEKSLKMEKQRLIENIIKIWRFCYGNSEEDVKRYNKILNGKTNEWLRKEFEFNLVTSGEKISHLQFKEV